MSALDWIRIRRTMLAYDYWMDVEGVSGRGRKQLRAELVGNLTDATAAVGFPAARRSLGSVRALAAAAAPDRDSRPRWVVGTYAAIVVFAIAGFATLGMTTAWADGVLAAGGSTIDVTGHPVFLPWAQPVNPPPLTPLGPADPREATRRHTGEGPRTDASGGLRAVCGSGQLKLSPQAQELPALGLSMVKPCFSMVSAKSIVAPSR
jgi:hypothetical protein